MFCSRFALLKFNIIKAHAKHEQMTEQTIYQHKTESTPSTANAADSIAPSIYLSILVCVTSLPFVALVHL